MEETAKLGNDPPLSFKSQKLLPFQPLQPLQPLPRF